MNANNPPPPDPDTRLISLEERLAFQDRLIEELNQVVLTQRTALEQVVREVAACRAALDDLIRSSPGENLPHEKPPHY